MDNSVIIRLTFLILSLSFIISLLRSLVTLLSKDWGKEGASPMKIINHFSVSIISFILFFIFVLYILPILS